MKMSKREGHLGELKPSIISIQYHNEVKDYLTYFHLNRPPPPIADTYSMFGVTINNDDAIIQSLESQVTLRYCMNFKRQKYLCWF